MRDRTAKFSIFAVVMAPALIFLASCEIPQSARIQASPTFQIPIPLGNGVDNSFIRPYISTEGIQEQLKGKEEKGKTAKIYKYNLSTGEMNTLGISSEGDALVQTYLITYPLFDMSLDFNKYLNNTPLDEDTNKTRVPPIEIGNSTATAVDAAMLYNNPGSGGLLFQNWVSFPPHRSRSGGHEKPGKRCHF